MLLLADQFGFCLVYAAAAAAANAAANAAAAAAAARQAYAAASGEAICNPPAGAETNGDS